MGHNPDPATDPWAPITSQGNVSYPYEPDWEEWFQEIPYHVHFKGKCLRCGATPWDPGGQTPCLGAGRNN